MKTLIVLEDVGVHYPGKVLFEHVQWTLYEGNRIALVGRNGCGKSTLLRIMSGQLDPTQGRCSIVGKQKVKIGYLDQSLLDAAVLNLQNEPTQQLTPLSYILSSLPSSQAEADAHYEDLSWEVRRILHGLSFTDEQISSPMAHLSGGWLLRMFIAKTLVNKPDVLLLDEPTNHLDLSSIQWLEEFLSTEFKGALVLVTHDLALQKKVTNSIAVLHGGNFFFRKGQMDYLGFLDSLKEDERVLEKHIEGHTKKINELKTFITRFKAKARMASRAQSKMKAMERLEEELAQLKAKLQRTQGFHFNLKFRFRMDSVGAKFPITLSHVHYRYSGDAPYIVKDVSFDVKRGQKIAIIGDNGAGKTTLLNVIAGRLKPQEGEVLLGSGVELGYFGQHQLDELSLENTVLENLQSRATDLGLEQLRSWLGAFGFSSDDDIQKFAKVLSGGERARLAMIRILCAPCNVCLLDEPTNHLDIETKHILSEAIKNFEGSVIFVSHDREFVGNLADRIIYVSVDHQITDHLGNLNTFFEKYPERVRHMEVGKSQHSLATTTDEQSQPSTNLSYEERKRRKNRRKSLEKKLSSLEQDLGALGEEKEQLVDESLSAAFYLPDNETRKKEVLDRISLIDRELNKLMLEWEKMTLEIEELNDESSQ